MLTHAPEALRLRTPRSWWPRPWPCLPRLTRLTPEMALYVAVCGVSLGAALVVILLLLQQDAIALGGPLALGPAVTTDPALKASRGTSP